MNRSSHLRVAKSFCVGTKRIALRRARDSSRRNVTHPDDVAATPPLKNRVLIEPQAASIAGGVLPLRVRRDLPEIAPQCSYGGWRTKYLHGRFKQKESQEERSGK